MSSFNGDLGLETFLYVNGLISVKAERGNK